MKRSSFIFFLSFFILLLFTTSCSKQKITACFTVPSTIHVNTIITVDCSCSTNARWYELYVDGAFVVDGYSATPQWKPTTTGSHTIKVVVCYEVPSPGTSTGGAQDNTSQTVTVVP